MSKTIGMKRRELLLGVAAGLASIAVVRAPARAAQFEWKFGDSISRSIPLNVRLTQAFAKIKAETNGQFVITPYMEAALGSDPAVISQLRLGAVEMYAGAGGLFDSYAPVASIENVPFAYPNYQTAWRAFDGEVGKIVRSELAAKGFTAFDRVWDNGFRQFTTSTKPIRTIDDLQGLKLRVPPSKFRVDAFRSLGASPTTISAGDLYTGLQTHLVDGQESPLIFIAGERYYEIQKYCSLSNHMWTAFWVFVNKDKLEALPKNFQEILHKNINAAALLQRQDNVVLDRSLRDKLARQGLTFNTVDVSGFKAKLRSSGFYARWRTEWGAAAWSALESYSGPLA